MTNVNNGITTLNTILDGVVSGTLYLISNVEAYKEDEENGPKNFPGIDDSGSTITQKFQVQGEVKKLLDSLYAESLFENFDDQLPDEIDGSHETKEYKIVIDFEEANQRTITGRYDKNGLPEDWSYFAEVVLKFLTSYGIGEMLDSTVYNKTKRRSDEYIYCSVTFGESYNTYDYLTDDDSIEVGDLVIVPVGKDNHQVVVEVVKIRYYQENKVPYPIDKTKKIIRKYTEEEFE